MFDAIAYNHWRVEQARVHVHPFIKENEPDIQSTEKIRRQARKLTLEDHVYNLSIESLKTIELVKHLQLYSPGATITTTNINEEDRRLQRRLNAVEEERVKGIIASMEGKGTWPVRGKRVAKFHNSQHLKKIRKLNTDTFVHALDRIPGNKSKECALCKKRRTQYWCRIYKIPLYRTKRAGDPPERLSHFDRWHNTDNLLQESNAAREETEECIGENPLQIKRPVARNRN